MPQSVLTQEEVVELIKQYHVPPLLDRDGAAKHLNMKLSTFDKFIARHRHLKRYPENGGTARYNPVELNQAYAKREIY